MDWNRMRHNWQSLDRPDGPSLEQLRPTAPTWRRVLRRDVLETVTAAVLLVFFSFQAWRLAAAEAWAATGFAIYLVALCIFVPVRLWRARRRIPEPDPGRSVLEFLREERSALAIQAGMLRSVARWYWGPAAFGVLGLFISINGLAWSSLAYVGLVAIVYAWIERANRRAARACFEPALSELDQQIKQMQTEENSES